MKFLFSFIIVLTLTLTNTSCKKKDDNNSTHNKTVAEKIQGIWHLNNVIYNDHVDNVDNRDTLTGASGDIVDFRTDGKVYSNVQGTRDTVSYSVTTDSQIIIDIYTFDIKILTDNAFTIYAKDAIGADYSEETDNFIR